jgi:murein DD-endopeptidase MepM/ murein hydrolase activator NlpD
MKVFAIILCSCICVFQVVAQTTSKKRNFIAKRSDVDIEKPEKKSNAAKTKSKRETASKANTASKKITNTTSFNKKRKRNLDANTSLKKVKLKRVSTKETTSKADLVRIKSSNKKNRKNNNETTTRTQTKSKETPKVKKQITLLSKTRKVKLTTKEIAKMQYNANRRKAAIMPTVAKKNKRNKSSVASNKNNQETNENLPVEASNNKRDEKLEEVKTTDVPMGNAILKEEKSVRIKRKSLSVSERMYEALADQKLLFPVPNGVIKTGFGLQRLENGIDINNPGLTISSKPGNDILASFDGTISNIIEEDANYYTVYLVHNGFMTTYHGVTNVVFVKGNAVTRGAKIGEVGIDVESGEAEIEFLLTELFTKKQQNLNPQKYLE